MFRFTLCFFFSCFLCLLSLQISAQSNEICTYARSAEKNYADIIKVYDIKVRLRDSSSYYEVKGVYHQRDTSKIILPDSCTLVLIHTLQFDYTDKPNLNYLKILEKTGSFKDPMTDNHLYGIVQELSVLPTFISALSELAELKKLRQLYLEVINNSATDSEYYLAAKKWVKKSSARKDSDLYKALNLSIATKN